MAREICIGVCIVELHARLSANLPHGLPEIHFFSILFGRQSIADMARCRPLGISSILRSNLHLLVGNRFFCIGDQALQVMEIYQAFRDRRANSANWATEIFFWARASGALLGRVIFILLVLILFQLFFSCFQASTCFVRFSQFLSLLFF